MRASRAARREREARAPGSQNARRERVETSSHSPHVLRAEARFRSPQVEGRPMGMSPHRGAIGRPRRLRVSLSSAESTFVTALRPGQASFPQAGSPPIPRIHVRRSHLPPRSIPDTPPPRPPPSIRRPLTDPGYRAHHAAVGAALTSKASQESSGAASCDTGRAASAMRGTCAIYGTPRPERRSFRPHS